MSSTVTSVGAPQKRNLILFSKVHSLMKELPVLFLRIHPLISSAAFLFSQQHIILFFFPLPYDFAYVFPLTSNILCCSLYMEPKAQAALTDHSSSSFFFFFCYAHGMSNLTGQLGYQGSPWSLLKKGEKFCYRGRGLPPQGLLLFSLFGMRVYIIQKL